MTDEHVLDKRRRALEESFFSRRNQELLDALRKDLAHQKAEQALAEHLGLKDPAVLAALVDVGIEVDTLAALCLIPLVAVAWADGKLEAAERNAVVRAAEEEGILGGTACHSLLLEWLGEPPPESLVRAWSDYVTALKGSLPPAQFREFGDKLLHRARAVAKAAGGFIGVHTISDDEEKVLKTLEKPFA